MEWKLNCSFGWPKLVICLVEVYLGLQHVLIILMKARSNAAIYHGPNVTNYFLLLSFMLDFFHGVFSQYGMSGQYGIYKWLTTGCYTFMLFRSPLCYERVKKFWKGCGDFFQILTDFLVFITIYSDNHKR